MMSQEHLKQGLPEELQILIKPPTPNPFDDLIDDREERSITLEIEKLRLAHLSLKTMSNNNQITTVSSKLAHALDQTATYLRNKKFYANPKEETAVKPILGQNSNPLMQRLAQGLMKRTTDKKAERYKETINELIEIMDPIEEEKSIQRSINQKASILMEDEEQNIEHNVVLSAHQTGKSPFQRFTRHVNFPYSKSQMGEDQPLQKLLEKAKKMELETFKKENPVSQSLVENSQIFQGMSKWFSNELQDIKKTMIKEKKKWQQVKVSVISKSGKQEELSVPQDVKKLLDPKKLLRRSINLARMQKPHYNRLSADFSKTGGALQSPLGDHSMSNLLKMTTDNTFNAQQQQQDRNAAYHELKTKIAHSMNNLMKIKNGQGALPDGFIGEPNNIPFLTNQVLQDEVKQYLKSGEIYIPKVVMPGISKKKSKRIEQMNSPSIMLHSPNSLNQNFQFQTSDSLDKPTKTVQLHQSTVASTNLDASGSIHQNNQFSQMMSSKQQKPMIGLLPTITDRSRSQVRDDSLLNLPLFRINNQSGLQPFTDTSNINIREHGGATTVLSQESSMLQEDDYELKDLNQIGPICLTNRKFNKRLERKLIFPRNPSHDPSLKKKPSSKLTAAAADTSHQLPTLVEYCLQKNIPFYENEMRYFDFLKGKQNYRDWTDNWKKYCNQNLTEEKKVVPPQDIKKNKFLMALMAMAKKAQDSNEAAASEPPISKTPTQRISPKNNQSAEKKSPRQSQEIQKTSTVDIVKKSFSKRFSQNTSPTNTLDTLKKGIENKIRGLKNYSPLHQQKSNVEPQKIIKILSKNEQLEINNRKMKARIEHLLDQHVNVKSKEVRDLMHEPAKTEILDGLPETTAQEKLKRRRKAKKRITDPSKAPKFYEKLEKRRQFINEKLMRILERVELDRPIVLREKFKVLWNMDSQSAQDSKHMKLEIGKLKTARNIMNNEMAEKYMQVLQFVDQRYQKTLTNKDNHKSQITGIIIKKTGQTENSHKPHECERRFMDFIRIIIEGGWVVQDQLEWIQILEFLDISNDLLESPSVMEFFTFVSQLFNFEEPFKASFVTPIHDNTMIYYGGEITAEDEEYDSNGEE